MNPLTCTPTCTLVRRRGLTETKKPLTYGKEVPLRGVAQLGSAPALGAGGPRFESGRPDFGKRKPDTHLGISGSLVLGL